MQPPGINSSVSALRFFFTVTLDRPDLSRRLTVVHQPRKLPMVLSVEEVTRLLEAAPGIQIQGCPRHRIWRGAAGFRGGGAQGDRYQPTRMLIRVEQGKGRMDRHAMLSPQLLELLRAWWREGRRRRVMRFRALRARQAGPVGRYIGQTRALMAACAARRAPTRLPRWTSGSTATRSSSQTSPTTRAMPNSYPRPSVAASSAFRSARVETAWRSSAWQCRAGRC